MRIADVCGFYAPGGGGVRRYVDQKFEAALRHGHDLTVIAPGAETRFETRPGGRIAWIESPPMPFDPAYRRFGRAEPVWRALDGAAPDLVEGSSPWRGGWIAGRWAGEAARTLIFHQDFVAGYPQTLLGGVLTAESIDQLFALYWARLGALSALFDATITASQWLAARLDARGVCRPIAVPFGVEADLFRPGPRDEALRRDLLGRCGAPPNGRLVLAVGRLHPEKRHHTIIEGFARARAEAPWPMGLVVVGDGPLRRRIERRVRRMGGVHLAGAVESRAHLACLYGAADVLAHGSAAETFGAVVAEALAAGLPVVAPAAGGAAELCRLGRSRTYSPGDPASLAAALLEMLAVPAGARVAGAVPTVSDHFANLFRLYETLVDERRRQGRPSNICHQIAP